MNCRPYGALLVLAVCNARFPLIMPPNRGIDVIPRGGCCCCDRRSFHRRKWKGHDKTDTPGSRKRTCGLSFCTNGTESIGLIIDSSQCEYSHDGFSNVIQNLILN